MEKLTKSPGYVLLDNIIPDELIQRILSKMDQVIPARSVSETDTGWYFADKDNMPPLTDVSVWWSHLIIDWPEFAELESRVTPIVKAYMSDSILYTGDFVVINPGSTWRLPHLDAPYRHAAWQNSKELLGVQCVVALQDMGPNSTGTGLVPDSQHNDWEPERFYNNEYLEYFSQNYTQPAITKGSVLLMHGKLLHSCMPSKSDKPRPAILMNYVVESIAEQMKPTDNIWQDWVTFKENK